MRNNIVTLSESDKVTSYKEAIEKFGLNWEVGLRPISTNVGGEFGSQFCEDYKAVVRLDNGKPLSVVGNRYVPTQNNNNDVSLLMDTVVQKMGAKYSRGGTVGSNEAKVFLQVELPEVLRVKQSSQDEGIKQYLLYSNSFDGSTQIGLGNVNTRIVCMNTFMMAFKELGREYRIRHTNSSEARLQEVSDIILQTLGYQKQLQVKIDWLADQKFTDLQMDLAMRKMFGVSKDTLRQDIPTRTRNSMDEVVGNFQQGDGAFTLGTAWGAYNAATRFSNHQRSVKNEDQFGNKRTESVLFGSGVNFNDKALDSIESVLSA